MRQGLGIGAFAAVMTACVSFAVGASPLTTSPVPVHAVSSHTSLLHRVVIYAKDGSRKLIDGRWNLGQAQSKLGVSLSADATKQLMACTGKIVCDNRGTEIFASAASVLRPDMLVTAKHVFSTGRNRAVSFGWCSFRSYLHRDVAVPIAVEQDQRKGYFLNNEDFIVVRLKRELADCNAFAINAADTSLTEGDEVLSVTSDQLHTLNKLSRREPIVAKGTIRSVSSGFLGGPPFYYADIDFDEGGSGGAVFALKDGRPVSDAQGRLVVKGISVAFGPHAKNGKPYSDEQNYTVVIGLQGDFRDLVAGKARGPVAGEPALCLQDDAAKIEVISEIVPPPPSETIALVQATCGGDANADCLAAELKKLTKGIEKLAASPRGKTRVKEKHQFKLRNDTRCAVCFTYNRCNAYGCWDEVVRASAKSTLYAGVRKQAPTIKGAHFCKSGGVLAEPGPPLPTRKPAPDLMTSSLSEPSQPPVPPTKPGQADAATTDPEAVFLAAKEKAKRDGVYALTSEDIRGLSLEQIKALRGY